MSFDAHAKSPDAPVAKRIPSYMLPKKKSLAQKADAPTNTRNRNQNSTISTSSSVTKVDDAQGESKIEVMQSSSPNAVKDDVPEERGMAALPMQANSPLMSATNIRQIIDRRRARTTINRGLGERLGEGFRLVFEACKNTNTVIVKTSSLQVMLRYYMYGMGRLRLPQQFRSNVKTVTLRTACRKGGFTSRDLLNKFDNVQRTVEYPIYLRTGPTTSLPETKMADVQGDLILLLFGPVWTIFDMTQDNTAMLPMIERYASASLALCADDKVVAEVIVLSEDDCQYIRTSFVSLTDRDQNHVSAKHPKMGHDRISILIPDTGSPDLEGLRPGMIRLYPGGLAALHSLQEEYRCGPTRCQGVNNTTQTATRLVLFNWHAGTSLGVVRVIDSNVKILDVRFLDDRHIICSSIRKIEDTIHPCVDLYYVPQDSHPMSAAGTIKTDMLPTMPHVASFQLPPLKSPQPGCLWARPPKSSSVISKYAIKVQHPSSLAYVNDQVMTFRLEGKSGGKLEKLQGVVPLSKLRDIMNRAIRDRSKRSAGVASTTTRLKTALGSGTSTSPGRVDTVNAEITGSSPEPVHIPWKDWSDAVSIQHSKSTTTLEPKFTQVASVARKKKDKTHAVMMIRDYNQQMLFALPGHMMRYLGHPTANYYPDEKNDFKEPTVKPFITSTEPKFIDTVLFGHIKYGLGHRMRMVDLGLYESNTATSKMFWDSHLMGIVPTTHDGNFRLHLYGPVYHIPEDEKKQGDVEDKEAEAGTDK